MLFNPLRKGDKSAFNSLTTGGFYGKMSYIMGIMEKGLVI